MVSVPRAASVRMLLAAVLAAAAAATSTAAAATPAEANCTVNIQGIVVTDAAAHGQPAACAPEVGRPDGTGTGRKVG
jgi:hypothetical protein